MTDEKQQLERRFHQWLKRRKGRSFKAEDFHESCGAVQPAEGWQRAMSGLIGSARQRGLIKPTSLTRDKFGSWKAVWKAVA